MGMLAVTFWQGLVTLLFVATCVLLILVILLGWAGIAIRRSRQADSAVLNARLEDVCHTSLNSRIEAACGKVR